MALGLALVLLTGVVAAVADGLDRPQAHVSWLQVTALFLVLTVAGTLQLRFQFHDEIEANDLFEVALAPVLLALTPWAVVGVAAGAKAVSQLALRVPPVKAGFNTAQWACAAAVGSLVLSASPAQSSLDMPLGLLVLAAALLAVAGVNHLAVASVLRLVGVTPVQPGEEADARGRRLLDAGAAAANLCFGLLLGVAYLREPLILIVALVPLVALYQGQRIGAAQAAEQARLTELRAASRSLLVEQDPRRAIPDFLERVRSGLGAAAVDLALLTDTTRQVVRAEAGEQLLRWEEKAGEETLLGAVLSQPSVLLAPPDQPDEALRRQLSGSGWPNVVSAPVEGRGTRFGVLAVYGRTGLRGYGASLRQVMASLADELAGALARSDLLAEMEAERARFSALVRGSSDVVLVLDPDTTVRYASPAAVRVLDSDPADLVGRQLADLVVADDAPRLRRWLSAATTGTGSNGPLEMSLPTGADVPRRIEALSRDLLDDPRVRGVVLNARDVSERQRAQALLARQALVLERIAADAPQLETQRLIQATLEEFLPGARAVLRLQDDHAQWVPGPSGTPRDDEVLDRLLRTGTAPMLRAEQDAERVVLRVGDAGDDLTPDERAEFRRQHIVSCWIWPLMPREDRPVDGSIAVFFPDERAPAAAERDLMDLAAHLAANAADRHRSQQLLAYQATHDVLTDLPNRSVVRDRIEQALARLGRTPGSLALIFVDLDNFKIINDSLGHRTGDRLLRELSARLLGLVRPGDTVARLGGDEFVLLCVDLPDPGLALAIADRILAEMSGSVRLDGHELFVSASLGIALAEHPGDDPDLLIDNADLAMYRAKERGGGRYELFDAAMRSSAARRLATQTSLRLALDRHELQVHYQPTVDLISGRVVGVEALARWEHPTRGLLAPAHFIPLAEETGLIVPLGAQVLREACRQLARWRHRYPEAAGLSVAVNLSPQQIASGSLVALVDEVLAENRLEPSALSLEITETTLMEDLPGTTTALHDLKRVGVRLTIDDFGTGYSSLSYLKQLPVDRLKLDQSFVRHVEGGPDHAITGMVIDLAHTLGLEIVAEGIETAGQLKTLCHLGCDIGQGYHLGRPVPVEEMELSYREEVQAAQTR